MGMYTRFTFWAEIPEKHFEDKSFLQGLLYLRDSYVPTHDDPDLPDHKLFTGDNRAIYAFQGKSYYFITAKGIEWTHDHIRKGYTLTIDCSFKNYDDEINDFLRWIRPYTYLGQSSRQFMGFKQYETDEQPTLIYFNQKRVNFKTTETVEFLLHGDVKYLELDSEGKLNE